MRRSWLRAAFLTFLLFGYGCGSRTDTPPLVGAWKSSVRFESGAFATIQDLQFLYVIHSDGTLTESSNYDAAPPVTPAYGTWRRLQPREFEARYVFFTTVASPPDAFQMGAGWMPSGHGVLTERIKLSKGGSAYTSTIRYEPFDKAGKPAEGAGTGVGRGERIRF